MAAHQTFPVEGMTPDGQVFAEDVQMVSARTAVGSIGVLAHHAPLLAMLDPAELRHDRADSGVETVLRIAHRGQLPVLDERVLAERLIGYETSRPDVLVAAAAFVKGWLEPRDIAVAEHDHNGFPVLVAEVGARRPGAPCVVLHGHLDVVPGRPEQFEPRVEGDRLIGRGAYDMKGGLAAMMCALKDIEPQERVHVRLVCVPDQESEELEKRSTDELVKRGLGADFAV